MDYLFYVLTMKTRTGKTLYLCADMNNCKWEFTPKNAIWFNTQTEASGFAKTYFKNFRNYKICEIETNV